MSQTLTTTESPQHSDTPQKMLVEVKSNAVSAGTDEEKHIPVTTDENAIKPIPKWQFTCLSISLGIGLFLAFMDGTITSTAIYSIAKDFDSFTEVTWIALAYTLADVGLAIVFASLSNVIGRFNCYLLAQALFVGFSLASGFARTLPALIACRCLQGIGGSGLYTMALIIWQEVSSGRYRQIIGGCIGLCIGIGGIMGPIVGGVITQNVSWRWIFWINPPVCLCSTVLFITTFPHGAGRLRGRNVSSARRIDYVGTLLLISGSVLPCFALMHVAEHPDLIGTAQFIGPIAAGCFCWVLLVAWDFLVQGKFSGQLDSAFPLRVFENRRFSAAAANSLFLGFGYVITIFNIPLRMQTVHAKGPLLAGITLMPLLFSNAIGSTVAQLISPHKDRLGPTLMTGSALMALGTGLLSTLGSSVDAGAKIYAFQIFVGFGFGMTASAATLLANMESTKEDHAVAQGITAGGRVFGGALGLSAATMILGNKVAKKLTYLSAVEIRNPAIYIKDMSPAQAADVRAVYSESFNLIFMMTGVVCAGGFLAACFAWNTSTESINDRLAHRMETEEETRQRQIALSGVGDSQKAAVTVSCISAEKAPSTASGSDRDTKV